MATTSLNFGCCGACASPVEAAAVRSSSRAGRDTGLRRAQDRAGGDAVHRPGPSNPWSSLPLNDFRDLAEILEVRTRRSRQFLPAMV